MKFTLKKSLELLSNTPHAIYTLLQGLNDEWITSNEGENTWTAKEVVAHLLLCEETNWMPRVRIILAAKQPNKFASIDMDAHFEVARNHSIEQLLARFIQLRKSGIEELKTYDPHENDYVKSALHPVIGEVSFAQLISAWVTHDLAHLAQIARVMAKQNKELVGGFEKYLNILKR